MAKIPVSILGATGLVGQRFVQLLTRHPFFEIAALTGSDRSAGQSYIEACRWRLEDRMPAEVRQMKVRSGREPLPGRLVFSALPATQARTQEPLLAKAGYIVCSNASAHRMDPDVPMVIPEINAEHLELIDKQRSTRNWPGLIITSPNCTTTGVVMSVKPLHDAFGVRDLVVVSLQAASGAGYPGIPALDLTDNIIPFIDGEEEKLERETRALLGKLEDGERKPASIQMSAHTNRVPVLEGHTICISIAFENSPTLEQVVATLKAFHPGLSKVGLPSAPEHPVQVLDEVDRPQPRLDRHHADGMVVSVGRVRSCSVFDIRMVSLVHNTIRGAAGGSILNAELLHHKGYLS